MSRIHRIWLISLLLILGVTACNTPIETGTEKKSEVSSKQEKQKPKKPAKDAAGMLYEGPGVLSGDRYSEEKAKKELEKLPKGLSAEEAYMELLRLFAEDYRPILKEINHFDTNPYIINQEPPDDPKAPGKSSLKTLRVTVLLDASGSMAGYVKDGQKMDLAKAAVSRFVSSLPSNTEVSLRVYGHKGSNQNKDKVLSCKSTEEVYSLSPYDEQEFGKAMNQFKPTGWTPIALAMKEAKKDLEKSTGEHSQNLIYIVSDGEETCGGDPVAVARELNQSNVKAVVNIIGFDVNDKGQRELQAAAKAGGGEYYSAQDEQDLREYVDRQNTELSLAWGEWATSARLDVFDQFTRYREDLNKLLDAAGKFATLIEQEHNRMQSGAEILNNLGKIDSEYDKVWSDINKRQDLLDQYRRRRENELQYELRENMNRLDEQLQQKRDEEQAKLKN